MTSVDEKVNIEDIKGRKLRLILDPGDASSPDFTDVAIIIEDILSSKDGYPLFVVRTDRPRKLQKGFVVERMLVAGIDMNLIDELYGTPNRPHGLPVLVGMWRISDDSALQRILDTKKPPPSDECIGRGELFLG